MAKIVFLLLSIILLPFSSLANIQDFCVTDLTLSDTPTGYPCTAHVTARDFYYHGLTTPGNITKPFKTAFAMAFVR